MVAASSTSASSPTVLRLVRGPHSTAGRSIQGARGVRGIGPGQSLPRTRSGERNAEAARNDLK